MPRSRSQERADKSKQATALSASQIRRFRVKDIVVKNKRPVDPKLIADLAMSIGVVGLQNPIIVYLDDRGRPHLVAGNHRREAYVLLGRKKIDCIVVEEDAIDEKLREVTENLHRSRMAALERAELTVNWWSAIERKAAVQKKNNKGRQRRDKGIRRAAKHLNMSRDRVRRSMAIASLPPEVKTAAAKAKLHNNQKALLALSRLPNSAQQIAEIHRISKSKDQKSKRKRSSERASRSGQHAAIASQQRADPKKRDGEGVERLKIAWLTVMSGRPEWKEASRKCRKAFCKWLKAKAAESNSK